MACSQWSTHCHCPKKGLNPIDDNEHPLSVGKLSQHTGGRSRRFGNRRRATANRRAKGFTRHQHATIQPMERRHLCTRYHQTVMFQRRTWGIEIHSATLDPGVEQREKKHSNKFTLRRISPRSSYMFSSVPRIETVESRNLRVYFGTRTSYTESSVKPRAVKRRQWTMARLAALWTHRSMLIDPSTGCEWNAGRED